MKTKRVFSRFSSFDIPDGLVGYFFDLFILFYFSKFVNQVDESFSVI